MGEFLGLWYPWIKALHVIAVITWMAGLFYLPRLFVHHAERAAAGSEADALLQVMERRLLGVIMAPSLIAVWVLGLALLAVPGAVDWSAAWPWVKAGAVIGLTWFHLWLAARRRDFAVGRNRLSGRTYRMMNEVPTLAVIVIVTAVIVKY